MIQKLTRIGVSVHPDILKNMEEVAQKRGFRSVSEMLRNVFLGYYENEFRAKYYGYQSGLDTSGRRLKNQDSKTELNTQIENMESMTNEELEKLVNECGYITEEEKLEYNWHVGEFPEDPYGIGLWSSHKNGSSKRMVFDIPHLYLELKKHFKKINK